MTTSADSSTAYASGSALPSYSSNAYSSQQGSYSNSYDDAVADPEPASYYAAAGNNYAASGSASSNYAVSSGSSSYYTDNAASSYYGDDAADPEPASYYAADTNAANTQSYADYDAVADPEPAAYYQDPVGYVAAQQQAALDNSAAAVNTQTYADYDAVADPEPAAYYQDPVGYVASHQAAYASSQDSSYVYASTTVGSVDESAELAASQPQVKQFYLTMKEYRQTYKNKDD